MSASATQVAITTGQKYNAPLLSRAAIITHIHNVSEKAHTPDRHRTEYFTNI